MPISRICSVCKGCFTLATLQCPRCRVNLTKLKARVRRDGHWKTLQTESHQEAQKFLSKFSGSLRSTQSVTPKVTPSIDPRVSANAETPAHSRDHHSAEVTLREVFNSFISWAETHKRSWKSDQQLFELRISPLGPLPLDSITPEMVQTLVDSLKSVRKEGELSPASKLQAAALIRRLFNFARKRRLWSGENPVSFIELEKFDNRRERYLSQGELQRLLNELDRDCNPTAALFIKFLLLTGRRRGEVLKLVWSDVDLDRGLITFRHTKNGKVQVAPISTQALKLLMEVSEIHQGESKHGVTRVFPFRSEWTLERVWKRIRRRAKLVDFRLHDLRHSFASLAASSGQVDIYTLQNLLGHRSIQMTQRYAHLFPGALRNAVEVVGGLISAPR